MANSKFELEMNSIDGDFSNMDIGRWFQSKGFEKIEFNNEKEYISTQGLVDAISFKLIKVESFDTFIKSAFGGSILVFECKVEDDNIKYNCYAPIWLFGIWTIKLKFKKQASYLFRYLKEGYKIKEEFDQYIHSAPKRKQRF